MTQRIDDSGDRPIGFGLFQLYPAARILKKDLDPVDIGDALTFWSRFYDDPTR